MSDGRDAPGSLHPLVDEVRDGVVVSRSTRGLLALTPLRADLLLAADAAGRRVLLVTRSDARLTDPLRDALSVAGGTWVVEDGSGDRWNGVTGQDLGSLDEAVAPLQVEPRIAPGFLAGQDAATLQLIVSASLRHRAEAATKIGSALEALARLGGGDAPAGWGSHEPAERAWDVDALTEHLRAAAPAETRVVAVGTAEHPLAGSTLTRRTDKGVEEVLQALIGLGAVGSSSAAAALDAVPDALAGLADHAMPLFALALARPGRADLTTAPVLQHAPEPLAMLIGPPGLRDLGVPANALVEEFDARIVGRPRIPGVLITFGNQGWTVLERLVARIGPERMAGRTGVAMPVGPLPDGRP